IPKSIPSSSRRSYSIRGIMAVARSRVFVDCRPQNPSIATPRSARCSGVMLSESGPRRCDCRKPLAPRSPVTLRIFSAKTGAYSTQCPSPSMTGCVSPLRISSGVWWVLIWLLPERSSAIAAEPMLPARPKSNGLTRPANASRLTGPHPSAGLRGLVSSFEFGELSHEGRGDIGVDLAVQENGALGLAQHGPESAQLVQGADGVRRKPESLRHRREVHVR